MIWRFINSGFHSGKYNMEYDEYLAHNYKNGKGIPTLRIYGWEPPAISIGYHQRMEEFNLELLQQLGIDIVRRPTGGRAIYHAHELTYCIVMNLDDRGMRSIYEFINKGILRGLNYLGIHARLSSSSDDFQNAYADVVSIPCFSTFAKSEIQYRDRKLVGSAQRRYDSIVLQHGSVLLGPQHQKIINFLSPNLKDVKKRLETALSNRTIDIETILGKNITFDETAECIKKGFEKEHYITFVDSSTIESRVLDSLTTNKKRVR